MSPKEGYEEEFGKPVCIIPCRKNSRRLKNKNKLEINDKPLYQYCIDAAVGSGVFARVWVSTDDMQILERVYEQMGTILPTKDITLITPHRRPHRLCYSTSQIRSLVRFMFTKLWNPNWIFCVLTPSNPTITPDEIKECYELLWEREANYIISVTQGKPVENALKMGKGGFIEPHLENKQSQAYKKIYYPDGGIIFGKASAFLQEYNYDFKGSRCVPYVRQNSVDIDTQEDFEYARYLMEVKT